MKIPYGSRHEIEVSPGDLCKFVVVSGEQFIGIILELTHVPWPRNIYRLEVLTPRGVREIMTGLIFRMEIA